MPLICDSEIRRIDQAEFSKIDYPVMGCAYKTQNELGRLFDEQVYSDKLCDLLASRGHKTAREVKLTATHQDFHKNYYIDLLVDQAAPYELKTTSQLNNGHKAQLLNYLHISDVCHGKLVNFRPQSVESQYVSTRLDKSKRRQFSILREGWQEIAKHDIEATLAALLSDWGAFLSLDLYTEALKHFHSPSSLENDYVQIRHTEREASSLQLIRINQDCFIYTSASKHFLGDHKKHLETILSKTDQKRVQWINFDQSTITLRSITKTA